MKFVAHTSRRSGRSRNAGMIFSSSFVTPCSGDGGSPRRWDAISSTSSMSTTACSRSSMRRNVSRKRPGESGRIGGESRGEDLDERPVEARGHGLRERGLARAGRTEQHHGPRRGHPELVGEVGARERQHQALLEQLLLVAHPAHGIPQAAGQHPAPEFLQLARLTSLHGERPLEVPQGLLLGEPRVAERVDAGLVRRDQRRQCGGAVPGHPCLDSGEQSRADASVAPVLTDVVEDDPSLVVRLACDRGADDCLALGRDHGDVFLGAGQHLPECVDGLNAAPSGCLPEVQDSVEVIRVRVPDSPSGHGHPPSRVGTCRARVYPPGCDGKSVGGPGCDVSTAVARRPIARQARRPTELGRCLPRPRATR